MHVPNYRVITGNNIFGKMLSELHIIVSKLVRQLRVKLFLELSSRLYPKNIFQHFIVTDAKLRGLWDHECKTANENNNINRF